jgi:hypothetical protein
MSVAKNNCVLKKIFLVSVVIDKVRISKKKPDKIIGLFNIWMG